MGCGDNWKLYPEYEGVDCVDFGQEHVADIEAFLPTITGHDYDEIMANHFLEHFDQKELQDMFDLVWKALRVGGLFKVVVPHKKKKEAWVLSHKTFWTKYTFEVLEKPIFERYGFGKWKLEKLVTNKRGDIHAWLRSIE